jgi:NAD-dependent SIR2 family protein deacetylase
MPGLPYFRSTEGHYDLTAKGKYQLKILFVSADFRFW